MSLPPNPSGNPDHASGQVPPADEKVSARTLEEIHRDVAFALQFRMEFIKHTMSLAAGIFAFSIVFVNDYVGEKKVVGEWWMMAGWGFMIVSLAGGLGHLAGWDRYYISYRDHRDKEIGVGKAARKSINRWRKFSMWIQIGAFILGLASIGVFLSLNLDKGQ